MRLAPLSGSIGVAILVAITAGGAPRLTFTFDEDALGAVPRGFMFVAMRQVNGGTWQVRESGARHYLTHAADPAAHGFALAVATAAVPNDIDLTTGIRFMGGDRLGGLIWRYRDNATFYSVDVNLDRHQAWLSRAMGGNKVQLDSAQDLDVDPAMPHDLRVVHRGDQITVQIDRIGVLHAKDRTFDSGRAGVWSGGSAETWFTNISIADAAEVPR